MGKKRVKITEDNLSWGITALAVICLSIAFYLIMTQMPSLKKHIGTVLNVLMPVIIGIIIAYLLLPVYNSIYRMLMPRLKKKMGEYYADGLSTAIAVTVSIVLMLTVVLGLAVLALPQIIQSIISIAYTIPPNLAKLSDQIVQLLKDNPTLLQAAEDLLQTAETNLNFIIRENVIPYFTGALGSITMGLINVAGFFVDLIIGLIVCVYILISKEKFSAQAKKLVYSVLPVGTANHLLSDTRRVHRIFGGFISGSIIDSLIIGMITFVALTVMKMPYITMISVIIGVTNIIPFFGPFIGAVPSLLIVLMVDPVKTVYLLIYIVVVQQLDGNVIKPKTLGTSTGLPSFWVLFAILVGGGFFGFAGLLLGVPVFATVYMLVIRWVNRGLRKKDLPYDTAVYRGLQAMDPSLHQPAEQPEEDEFDDNPFERKKKSRNLGSRTFHCVCDGLKKRVCEYQAQRRDEESPAASASEARSAKSASQLKDLSDQRGESAGVPEKNEAESRRRE